MQTGKHSVQLHVTALYCVLVFCLAMNHDGLRPREKSFGGAARSNVFTFSFGGLMSRKAHDFSRDDSALLRRVQTNGVLDTPDGQHLKQLVAVTKVDARKAGKSHLPLMSTESQGETPIAATGNSIIANIQRTPVFIFASEMDGTVNKVSPLATGFFVIVPATNNRLLWVFVTARHVIDRLWGDCSDPNPTQIYLRFNLRADDPASKSSGVEYVRLDTNSFYEPNVNDIDVAVSIVGRNMIPRLDKYDVVPLPVFLFPTDEELQSLKIGDQVYSTGLVPSSAGIKKNHPSFTYATVSNLTDEPSTAFCNAEANPTSLQIWGLTPGLGAGRSGSPIFLTRNRMLDGLPKSGPVLIGVQSMATGSGDSGMTSAYDLYKTIQAAAAAARISGLNFRRGFR